MPYTVSINIFNKYIHLNEPGIVKKTKKKQIHTNTCARNVFIEQIFFS